MSLASRYFSNKIAVVLTSHLLVSALVAVISIAATSGDFSGFFGFWLAMVLFWPLFILSLVITLLASRFLFPTRGVGGPAIVSVFRDDEGPAGPRVSMDGSPMRNGHDTFARPFGMHDH